MRNHKLFSVAALALLLGLWSGAAAQTAENPNAVTGQITKAQAFDPHDLAGIWDRRGGGGGGGRGGNVLGQEPPYQPALKAKFEVGKANAPGSETYHDLAGTTPDMRCDPLGIPAIYTVGFPIEILQVPGRVIMFFERNHDFRPIWMDQQHAKEPDPTWLGDTVGRWDGNTLVVDTIGITDQTWIDRSGHLHSDSMHVIERFTRVDHDTLNLDMTIDDPKAFAHPWTLNTMVFKLHKGDYKLDEYYCTVSANQQYMDAITHPENQQPRQK